MVSQLEIPWKGTVDIWKVARQTGGRFQSVVSQTGDLGLSPCLRAVAGCGEDTSIPDGCFHRVRLDGCHLTACAGEQQLLVHKIDIRVAGGLLEG